MPGDIKRYYLRSTNPIPYKSKTSQYILDLLGHFYKSINHINRKIELHLKQEQAKLIKDEETIQFLTILRKSSQLIVNKLCEESLIHIRTKVF